MNYTALFNLLYSTEISEATKFEIINKIDQPIQESTNVEPLMETYMEFLDTLVYSTASEALIYNIIDETFAELDEDFINEVSDEWVKRKTEAGLKQREQAHRAAQDSVKSGVIGLSQLNRQAATKAKLDKGRAQAAARTPQATETPKAESGAMGKLKSAVGKVKSWAEKKSPMHGSKDVASLSRLIGYKANKDNIGAETLRQQTTHKGAEAPKNSEVKAEAPKPKPEKIKATKTSPSNTLEQAKKLGDKIHRQVQSYVKKADAEQAKRDKAAQKEVADRQKRFEKLTSQKPKKEEVKQPEIKSEVKAEEAPKNSEIKAEAPKVDKATEKAIKNAKKNIANTISKRSSKNNKKATEAPKVETPATEAPAAEEKKKSGRKGSINLVKNIAKSKVKGETPAAETPKVEASKKAPAESMAASTNKETPKEEPKLKVDMDKVDPQVEKENKAFWSKMKREAKAARAGQEKMLQTYKERRQDMTAKPGYDAGAVKELDKKIADLEKTLKVTTNEALSELALMLLTTNISESCYVEVMEMVAASKANADKVKKKLDKEKTEAMNDLYKDVEAGKPENPETLKKLDNIGKREERFNAIYKKKFNNNP
jgi:hypothetical protein